MAQVCAMDALCCIRQVEIFENHQGIRPVNRNILLKTTITCTLMHAVGALNPKDFKHAGHVGRRTMAARIFSRSDRNT
jgi:hypothetical protein